MIKYTWNILPLYIQLWPSLYWLCMWSHPLLPANKYDFLKALRITFRYGEYHSKIIFIIKKGG